MAWGFPDKAGGVVLHGTLALIKSFFMAWKIVSTLRQADKGGNICCPERYKVLLTQRMCSPLLPR